LEHRVVVLDVATADPAVAVVVVEITVTARALFARTGRDDWSTSKKFYGPKSYEKRKNGKWTKWHSISAAFPWEGIWINYKNTFVR